MSDSVKLWEKPQAKEIFLIAGWRQWADAGSVSSGLPDYLIQLTSARPVGSIDPHGYYLFQIPGTHHLLRPVVKYERGYPESLDSQRNEFFYSGDEERGLVIFLGDEPHMDIDRYAEAFLEAAQRLGVKRIIGLGGVYGEVPYDKERSVSSTCSQKALRQELKALSVNLSDYQGGASIDSYICRKSAEKGLEFVSFYAFVPLYDFSNLAQVSSSIRVERDMLAWYGILQRINFMLKLDLDLSDLEEKSRQMIETLNQEVRKLEEATPQLGISEYFQRLAADFSETPFVPPDDFWDEKLRGLFDNFD